MRAFSLKSKIAAAAAVAITAAAVAPAQAQDADWLARHRGGHYAGGGGQTLGSVGQGYVEHRHHGGYDGGRNNSGYYVGGGGYNNSGNYVGGGGYYGGGYYNGGYGDGGFPLALGALGIMTGAAIAAEPPYYASAAPGCMVRRPIFNRYHHVIGHRWVDVCY